MKGLTPTKIEWCRDQAGKKGFSWNIITGCKNGCSYCYARRLAEGRLKGRGRYVNGFEPTFHEEILNAPLHLKRPSRIFVSSMGELWGPWVKVAWQYKILASMFKSPQHTFLNLTKNPQGLLDWERDTILTEPWPSNLWLGVSVDTMASTERLPQLARVKHPNKFVSFEPLLEDVTWGDWFTLEGIKWVIIGAETGPGAKPYDRAFSNRVSNIFGAAVDIPVFIKDNILDKTEWVAPPREFPEGMP